MGKFERNDRKRERQTERMNDKVLGFLLLDNVRKRPNDKMNSTFRTVSMVKVAEITEISEIYKIAIVAKIT